jgi:hypothetical protein
MHGTRKETPVEAQGEGRMALIEPRPEEYEDFLQARIWQIEQSLKWLKRLLEEMSPKNEERGINLVYKNQNGVLTTRFYTVTFLRKDYEVARWLLKELKKQVVA